MAGNKKRGSCLHGRVDSDNGGDVTADDLAA